MTELDFRVVTNQPHPSQDANIVTLSAKPNPANPGLGSGSPSADLRMTIHDKELAKQFVAGETCKLTIAFIRSTSSVPSKPTGTGVLTE